MQFTGIDTIVFNAGHSPLVIDSVQFTGNAGYPAPAVFALRARLAPTTAAALAEVRPPRPNGC